MEIRLKYGIVGLQARNVAKLDAARVESNTIDRFMKLKSLLFQINIISKAPIKLIHGPTTFAAMDLCGRIMYQNVF